MGRPTKPIFALVASISLVRVVVAIPVVYARRRVGREIWFIASDPLGWTPADDPEAGVDRPKVAHRLFR